MPTWGIIALSVYGGISAVLFVIGWWFGSIAVNPTTGSPLTWGECAEVLGMAVLIAVFWPLLLLANVLSVFKWPR